MKNYFDQFYEVLHKNSIKRRRMISLLMVLSIFVSSSVVWELRGTVVTMVNEPIEELEADNENTDEVIAEQLNAHVHTDECYENVLICEDESEEHIHTEECYEEQLVCGYDDINDSEENTELSEDVKIVYEDENEAEDAIEEIDNDEGESDEEDIPVEDVQLSAVRLSTAAQAFDGNAPLEEIETVDNIARGIKFTLFDYGDSELEGQTNNYGLVTRDIKDGDGNVTGQETGHFNVKTSGINTNRDPSTDIMFFAYGTPPEHGTAITDGNGYQLYLQDSNGNYLDKNGNILQDQTDSSKWVELYMPGTPDRNNYSGDYNLNSYKSGNRPVQGIVKSELGSDGYPVIDSSGSHSLDYLFNTTPSEYKRVYENVNHLLKSEKSDKNVEHLIYNSNENYAYFNKDTNNFTIYNQTFDIINDNHHKKNDVNNIKIDKETEQPVVYSDNKDPGFKIGFFPFDEYDDTRRDPNYDGNGYNHHFGMTMEAKFSNPAFDGDNVKEPITFKYSGDDDMWVFVDGKLVLDIGGIHEPAGGMIDFSNGLVWVQDNAEGQTLAQVKSDLHYDDDDDAWDALPKPIGTNTASTTTDETNKWIVTNLSTYFSNDWHLNGQHEIKMFYLERGGCYSNLAMEMNLPTLKPLSVIKNVDYQDHLVKGLYENNKYWFQVYEWKKIAESDQYDWVIPSGFENNGLFALKANERKDFLDLDQSKTFKVVELGTSTSQNATGPEVGIDSNTFSQVKVNGIPVEIVDNKVDSGGHLLSEVNSYTFNNQIRQDMTDLRIKKVWNPPLDNNSTYNDFVVKFKIMRTDTSTGEVKQVALKESNSNIKKRTFTISSSEWNDGKEITGLLSQYGNHHYTYSVEEINVPNGYKDSYGTDSDGNLVITNTDMTKTELYVQKLWVNKPDSDTKVKVKLTRKRIGYSGSTNTSLTVRILDEGGNEIKTETIENVYAGGSAEIAYSLPDGVKLYKGDANYPKKQIGTETEETITNANNNLDSTLYVKFEEDENILAVQNLADSSNTVTFKVTAESAEDDLMLIHHSFSRGTSGWESNSGSQKDSNGFNKIITSNTQRYAKGDALLVRYRENGWQGARLYLDPAKFKVNKTYTFSTYVYFEGSRYDGDRKTTEENPESIVFAMTYNDGLEKSNNGSFHQLASKTVTAGNWVQLTGTVTFPEDINPYGMYIIIETRVPQNESFSGPYSFRMDEFVAVEGAQPISVSQQNDQDIGGVVTIGYEKGNSETIYHNDFTTLPDEWTIQDFNDNGDNNDSRTKVERITETGQNNSYVFNFLQIYNRNQESDGIRMSASALVPGRRYRFQATVQGAGSYGTNGDNTAKTAQLSINTINKPQGGGEYSNYVPIASAAITAGENKEYEIGYIDKEYTIPYFANKNQMYIYFETPSGSGQTGPFRIHEVTITDVTPGATEIKSGYTINNKGQYVSNYDNYRIILDTNSVTTPLKLDGNYTDEPGGWEKIVTLGDDNAWYYFWKNYGVSSDHLISEDNGYLYKYYIEEISITQNGVDVPIDQLSNDYNITIDGNGVATNDQNNPITVSNEYLWYTLPATGGIGADKIYLLGIALTIIGILGGCSVYSRKRRRE